MVFVGLVGWVIICLAFGGFAIWFEAPGAITSYVSHLLYYGWGLTFLLLIPIAMLFDERPD